MYDIVCVCVCVCVLALGWFPLTIKDISFGDWLCGRGAIRSYVAIIMQEFFCTLDLVGYYLTTLFELLVLS